jgi:hypothetical protein
MAQYRGDGFGHVLGVCTANWPHRTFVAKSVLLIVQCGREIRLNGGITVVLRIREAKKKCHRADLAEIPEK